MLYLFTVCFLTTCFVHYDRHPNVYSVTPNMKTIKVLHYPYIQIHMLEKHAFNWGPLSLQLHAYRMFFPWNHVVGT